MFHKYGVTLIKEGRRKKLNRIWHFRLNMAQADFGYCVLLGFFPCSGNVALTFHEQPSRLLYYSSVSISSERASLRNCHPRTRNGRQKPPGSFTSYRAAKDVGWDHDTLFPWMAGRRGGTQYRPKGIYPPSQRPTQVV